MTVTRMILLETIEPTEHDSFVKSIDSFVDAHD